MSTPRCQQLQAGCLHSYGSQHVGRAKLQSLASKQRQWMGITQPIHPCGTDTRPAARPEHISAVLDTGFEPEARSRLDMW